MSLSITVPVKLTKDEHGTYIEITSASGDATMLEPRPGLEEKIFAAWAGEQFSEACLRKRRRTGLKDSQGREVYEGDIIEGSCNKFYPVARAVVKWEDRYASFIYQGRYESGGGYSTLNLEDIHKWTVVGNVFQTPQELYPAKKVT